VTHTCHVSHETQIRLKPPRSWALPKSGIHLASLSCGPFFRSSVRLRGGFTLRQTLKPEHPNLIRVWLDWLGLNTFSNPSCLSKNMPRNKTNGTNKNNKQNQRDATSRVNEQERAKTQVGGG
jgi:hypothetical protein